MEKFKEEVLTERAKLPEDPRWNTFVDNLDQFEEQPLKPPVRCRLEMVTLV